jgi:hypothetical protein
MKKTDEKSVVERNIYENALQRMEKFGTKSIMSPHLLEKRETIKSSLLEYYESTEEFEKCKFISEFFDLLEKEIKISSVLSSLKKD